MTNHAEFQEWPKISRFRALKCRVTEKLDGTNAQILVPDSEDEPLIAGSRNKWLRHDGGKSEDNFGFAQFVHKYSDELRRVLGPGRHYGEWYGAGIGRKYGMSEKRLMLFSPVERYSLTWARTPDGLHEPIDGASAITTYVQLAPVLYEGLLDMEAINAAVAALLENGSRLVPGWKQPEGVVIEFAHLRFKITDAGDLPKWQLATAK